MVSRKDGEWVSFKDFGAKLISSWFGRVRSTEAMIRGAIIEAVVLVDLGKEKDILGVRQCGLIGCKDIDWSASFPDRVCLIDVEKTTDLQKEIYYEGDKIPLMMALVEIKTCVEDASVPPAISFTRTGLGCVRVESSECAQLIRLQHRFQMLHHAIYLGLDTGTYVCASKSQVIYKLFVLFAEDLVERAKS